LRVSILEKKGIKQYVFTVCVYVDLII